MHPKTLLNLHKLTNPTNARAEVQHTVLILKITVGTRNDICILEYPIADTKNEMQFPIK